MTRDMRSVKLEGGPRNGELVHVPAKHLTSQVHAIQVADPGRPDAWLTYRLSMCWRVAIFQPAEIASAP